MSTYLNEFIAAFSSGNKADVPMDEFIINGRPDPAALRLLSRELATRGPENREAIVDLLVKIGLATDPLTPKGAEVLRDQQIIAVLAGPGLATEDLGQYAAMHALRRLVVRDNLVLHEDAIVKALLESPSDEAFLLAAKTKPVKDKVLVEQLARSPERKEMKEAKIARAALGAMEIENEFITAAENAKTGQELADALDTLALIGTQRSLKAIAGYLRTPMTILVPNAFEKSVRLDVLEALRYNYPDQPLLYPNNIYNEEDYRAAELFCTNTLGVTFTEPPPPFMTYRGFPSF